MKVLGTTSGGVRTRRQALGVASAAQIATQVRCGHWQQPWPGGSPDAGGEPDAPQRA